MCHYWTASQAPGALSSEKYMRTDTRAPRTRTSRVYHYYIVLKRLSHSSVSRHCARSRVYTIFTNVDYAEYALGCNGDE